MICNVRVSKRVRTTSHHKLGSILDRHKKCAQKFASLIATDCIVSGAAHSTLYLKVVSQSEPDDKLLIFWSHSMIATGRLQVIRECRSLASDRLTAVWGLALCHRPSPVVFAARFTRFCTASNRRTIAIANSAPMRLKKRPNQRRRIRSQRIVMIITIDWLTTAPFMRHPGNQILLQQ